MPGWFWLLSPGWREMHEFLLTLIRLFHKKVYFKIKPLYMILMLLDMHS